MEIMRKFLNLVPNLQGTSNSLGTFGKLLKNNNKHNNHEKQTNFKATFCDQNNFARFYVIQEFFYLVE
jgi:hypothetical protein